MKFCRKELLSLGEPSYTRIRVDPDRDIINLGAGDPDFNQPELINKSVYDALKAGYSHYSFDGDMDFKRAISEYYKKYGVNINPESQICLTSGASEAIFRVFGALLNPEDELIVMDPSYQGYSKPAEYFGAKLVRAKQGKDENGVFRPVIENVKKAVTGKTKGVIICNPDNPCGAVYREDELKTIAEVAIEEDLLVISDEIYTEFVWGGREHLSTMRIPGMQERTITIMSFSKTFAWTGFRVGFIITSPQLKKLLTNVPIGVCSIPTAIQRAGITALKEGWNFVETMRSTYEKRLNFMVPRLNEIDGIKCPYPEGTFYCFADISEICDSSNDFALDFFKQEKVRVVPGIQYGEGGEGHIRFALVRPISELTEAARRLEDFIKKNF